MTDLRSTIHSAYTFVRSVETSKAAAALTLDHVIQEQISSLKKGETRSIIDARGESLAQRTSRFDQLEDLERTLDAAVRAIQDAGDDSDKLAALGIFEANKDSKADSDVSTNVEENS